MTDRIQALTVVLDQDYREDDVEVIVAAIRMVRCVLDVTHVVADTNAHVARQRTRAAWRTMIADALDRNPEL